MAINQSFTPPRNSSRIEYIDLMKGICITLVVLIHCKISFENQHIVNMLEHLRMPLYFFLSGLFFKEYGGFIDFTIRKIDKLLIPCLFFSLIFIIPDLTLLHPEEANRIFTGSYWKELILYPRNGYLWFLRALFFANIFYYLFHISTNKLKFHIRFPLILLISYSIFLWVNNIQFGGNHILCWLRTVSIFTAIYILPLFLLAHEFKSRNFLAKEFYAKQTILIFIICLLLWIICSNGRVSLHNTLIDNNLILFYIGALGGIGCIWCIAKWINYLPLISYLGRYSLIILGTHIVFVKYGQQIGANPWLIAIITLLCMPAFIWFFKKYFPYFTAQKDFIYALYRRHSTHK